ncbi:hypothetical protein EHQ30_10630 [Leptospira brenneri]|uniref:DUF4271 domain-containing protein n=2 Tax=Leptospira brenneri TaxID=2023182 RepID=A0A5F1ZBH9_9LEPT|nr:hypothetical protein EHQ30_10630 [Leptospira brenneri]
MDRLIGNISIIESVKVKIQKGRNWLLRFPKSYYFFITLYVFFYAFHCFWNWDEFMILNRSLELEAVNSGKQVSLLRLYPFQIIAVFVSAALYFLVCVGINVLFSLGCKEGKILRTHFVELFRNLIRLFFLFVCVLFLGNQILGYFLHSGVYSVLVIIFWTSVFLLFIIENGKLYRRLFQSTDRNTLLISHSLGYVNPILFVFFVLILANL